MIQKPSDFKTNFFIDGNYVEAAGGRLATLYRRPAYDIC